MSALLALGCGGGGSKPAAEPAPPPPPPEPVSLTGAEACDALLAIERCLAKDLPEVREYIDQSEAAWRDWIANAESRQMTIDTCNALFLEMADLGGPRGCTSDYQPPAGTRERVASLPAEPALPGEPICDEVMLLALCASRNDPVQRAQVEDGIEELREALEHDATRPTAIDFCAGALPEVEAEAHAAGCGQRTGSVECDELLDIQRCMARDVAEAADAVEEAASAWRDAVANPDSRQVTIDTCKQALRQMREAARSVGC